MYKHILVATDGSALAAKAVTAAFQLAKAVGSKVTAVTVTEPLRGKLTGEAAFGFPIDDLSKMAAAQAKHVLDGVKDMAAKAGITCGEVHVKEHHAADGILLAAREGGCDLIVMASHGRRGLERLLVGSETVRVLTHSTVPVLVCR